MNANLAVGITYFEEFEPILQSYPNLVDILEIEPQSFWIYDSKKKYLADKILQKICSKSYQKLIHSVGCPVGTSTLNKDQIPFLQEMVSLLKPKWISEHLNFNHVSYGKNNFWTGFLLPPLQTSCTLSAYIKNINLFKRKFPIPFAIENGVSYLKPRRNEMDDGEFVGKIIANSNCGLILDIHNLWTNEQNGRQCTNEFLRKIIPEKVWEIHVSGGEEKNGYWIDAHSTEIPKSIIKLMYYLVPRFPNLQAIIFEVEPSRIREFNGDTIRSQLKVLHAFKSLKRIVVKKSKNFTSRHQRI